MAGYEIINIAYGIEVTGRNDPYVQTAEHAVGAVVATASPGSYLVNVLPIRKSVSLIAVTGHLLEYHIAVKYVPEWLPGTQFRRDAHAWRKSVMELRNKPFEVLKDRMVSSGPFIRYREVQPL